MSLFVNPAQFGEQTDLNGYPRDEAADLEAARDAGVDIVFAPSPAEMYPAGYQTWVEVTELGAMLEGEHRPGHFRGVATVCLKLFEHRPPRPRVLRAKGRPAGRRAPTDDLRPRARAGARRRPERCETPTGSRSPRETRPLHPKSGLLALALPRALAHARASRRPARSSRERPRPPRGRLRDRRPLRPSDASLPAVSARAAPRPPIHVARRGDDDMSVPAGKLALPELAVMKHRGDRT